MKILLTLSFLSSSAFASFGSISFRHNDPISVIDNQTINLWWVHSNLKYSTEKFLFNSQLQFEEGGLTMFSVQELYYKNSFTHLDLKAGRFNLNYSTLDKNWGLGKINNRVNFDFFNPDQEGLVGIGLSFKKFKNITIDGFFSYLNVPELNPPLNIDNDKGTISSKSSWADAPDSVATSGSLTFPLNYKVNTPSISDLVFKPSLGLNFKVHNFIISDLIVNFFAIYKPENQLSNEANVELEITPITSGKVTIDPSLSQHFVFGGSISKKFSDRYHLNLGLLSNKLDKKSAIDSDVINDNIGLGIDINRADETYMEISSQYETEILSVDLGFLKRLSSFSKESTLDTIPRWDSVVHLGVEYSFLPKFLFQLDVKFDFGSKDRVYQSSIGYSYSQYLSAKLGFQIIGSPQSGDGFWARYRENDSVFADVKITF